MTTDRIDRAIAAYRWVCGDHSIPIEIDSFRPTHAIVDNSIASEQIVHRLLPTVTEINSVRDVRAFLASVIVADKIDADFVPTISFCEYQSNNENVYTEDQIEALDATLLMAKVYFSNDNLALLYMTVELLEIIHLPRF